ncbi:helix-turn-helix domain-containing protein [Streptomyces sp. A7024]|uniref:Helix-turn-helix domain-containing protein n=1 Tax=Streptomyces coryli TaxID=1128680 RepID=A0A6G4U0P3_9ACTN|nr:helix-turn-helix domain-containing protein [Streptomyces coryli]NGN65805.1 helix-turn-helix domain-containing protein [Streptomyces coryli]
MASELAELLEELKQRSGRSYSALAHRTGLSRSTLHRYCQGITVPGTFGAIEQVARVSGASPEELDRLYRAWYRATAGEAGQGDEPPERGVAEAGGAAEAAESSESAGSSGPTESSGPAKSSDRAKPSDPAKSSEPTESSEPSSSSPAPEPAARPPWWRRTRPRLVALLVVLVTLAGGALAYDGDRKRTPAGRAPATGGEQRPVGPEWHEAPRRISPEFFGMTINSDTGLMPGFRTGSARLWNSETRWANIEPKSRQYRWQTLDRLVRAAERDRLPVLFTIGGTPWWAAPDGKKSGFADSSASPPDDLKVWDRFVTKLATRYRDRIGSYELWDYPSHRLMYAGSLDTLAEMVERAARIIRRIDPEARLACPSFGVLWTAKGRQLLREFARTGAYEHCDAAALKMPPRTGDGKPEEIIELTRRIANLLHEENANDVELWNTGPEWDIGSTPPLDARRARDYAARFFLAGLYSRHYGMRRMYFYNWGSTHVPIIVQPVGGPPAEPGKRVGRLMTWLDGARISACGQGTRMGLPPRLYSCRFERDGSPLTVTWSTDGRADVPLDEGAHRVHRLNGSTAPARPGERIDVGEEPVLVEHR